ncbi:phage protein [uncultured Brevibacillus sp.]|uniref:phage protein n=1 Tax=uncultured Brevibacillus sp. TaxID=169970 RepID=UPI002596022D|nr:phage protein [uncultured Brevibacillus sp.]
MYTTYSFADVAGVISHSAVGQYVATGEGTGSISVSMTTDRSAHDVAADGFVMVSKIKGRNGTLTISVQQTSALNKWLLKLYNYLEQAPTSEWAGVSITLRSSTMQDLIRATGVSFQKLPDKPFQAQGQQVSWVFMAADIDQSVA